MDEEIPRHVPESDKIDTMSQPKTREADFASSIFEWVKTDRQGDVCRFQKFTVENGIEFVVFNDGSRVNSALIGDVVLKHEHESQLMGTEIGAPAKTTGNPDEPYEFPVISDIKKITVVDHKITEGLPSAESVSTFSGATPITTSPSTLVTPAVQSILEKAKKKKQKISLELQLEIPSSDVLNIIRENFNGSDEDLYNFFIQKIDKKKFVSAIINAVSNK